MLSFVKIIVFIILYFAIFLGFDILYQTQLLADKTLVYKSVFWAVQNIFTWTLFWVFLKETISNKSTLVIFIITSIVFFSIPNFLENPIIRLDYENLLLKSVLMGGVGLVLAYFKKWKAKELLLSMLFFGFIPLINLGLSSDFTYTLNVFYPVYKLNMGQILLDSGTLINWSLALLKSMFFVGLGYLFIDIFERKTPNFTSEHTSKNYLKLFVYKTLLYASLSAFLMVLLGQNTFPIFSNKIAQALYGIGLLYFIIILVFHTKQLLEICFKGEYGSSKLLLLLAAIPFLDLLVLALFKNIAFLKKMSFKPKTVKLYLSISLVAYAIIQYFLTVASLPNSAEDLSKVLIYAHIIIPVILALITYFLANTQLSVFALILFSLILIPLLVLYFIPTIEQNGSFERLLFTVNILLHSVIFMFLVLPLSLNNKI